MGRKEETTVKGKPVTLMGNRLREGCQAPDFKVIDVDMKEVTLGEFKNKVKLIASVPSLDTPVCDLQIRRFNDEASKLSGDLNIIFVSMDLPFAQKRFCHDNKIKAVKTFSDYRYADFGEKYGVLIKELRLLARAIFVIGRNNVVEYIEYVKELTSHPDYEAALKELKEILK
ncbi:MAG: thiol peroxidase [Candidatus Aureabacteria bacterium]|nr:thiol peroxidase [Candidatus Auribacterota bacterium]